MSFFSREKFSTLTARKTITVTAAATAFDPNSQTTARLIACPAVTAQGVASMIVITSLQIALRPTISASAASVLGYCKLTSGTITGGTLVGALQQFGGTIMFPGTTTFCRSDITWATESADGVFAASRDVHVPCYLPVAAAVDMLFDIYAEYYINKTKNG